MLNVFSKTMPWMVASLLAATTVFGQSQKSCDPKPVKCEPVKCCEPVPPVMLVPAYNQCGRIDVRGSWDVYAGASFTYWQARQENMEVGLSVLSSSTTVPVTAGGTMVSNVINHNFKYEPGFKVTAGLNFDHDCWDAYAEYTWYNATTTTSASYPAPQTNLPNGSLTPVSSMPSMSAVSGTVFNTAVQSWTLKMQFLDAALARTYYVGTRLTFRSIFGARFAWFSQNKLSIFSSDTTLTSNTGSTRGTDTFKQNFSTWGAGPLAGLNTNWVFGEDFRLIGNGSFDLLYTRVQSSNSKQDFLSTAGVATVQKVANPRCDFLMPHANLEMGLGWGSYFDCHNWHIDMSATYGFQVFWNGNQFRDFNGATTFGSSTQPSGNLYVHGLTATLRVDF